MFLLCTYCEDHIFAIMEDVLKLAEDVSQTKESSILFYKNRTFKLRNFRVLYIEGLWRPLGCFQDVTVGDVSDRGECNPEVIKLETVVEHV